jgi:hypothetical protein
MGVTRSPLAEYQRALAAGSVDAIVATFEPDGYAREPAGGDYVDRGPASCGRSTSARVVKWGRTELPPEPGVAVYVRSDSDRMAAHLRRRGPADQLTSCWPPSMSNVAPVSAVLLMRWTANAATSCG